MQCGKNQKCNFLAVQCSAVQCSAVLEYCRMECKVLVGTEVVKSNRRTVGMGQVIRESFSFLSI